MRTLTSARRASYRHSWVPYRTTRAVATPRDVPIDPEIGNSPAIPAPLAPSDPQMELPEVQTTAKAPQTDYGGGKDFTSDTTKTTEEQESWQVNAKDNVVQQQGETTERKGQWLRKIKLTVYAQTGSSGSSGGDGKTGSGSGSQGGSARDDSTDAGGGSDNSPTAASGSSGASSKGQSEGIDLSQLRINFEVRKATSTTPDFFKAKVYNLSKPPGPNTVGKVKQYGRVQLAAGYGDNFGMIFDGTVLLYVIGKENPVDSYIEIHGGDGDELLNHGAVALNWPAGSTPSQRTKDMLSAANIPVGEVQTVKGEQKSVRAQSYVGMVDRGIRNNTNATQSDFFIENGKAYVIPWNGYRKGDIVELSPTTGLVGIPKVTPNGIEAQCLLNPKLRIGGLVKIASDLLSDVPFIPGAKDSFASPGTIPSPASGGQQYAAAATSPEGYYKIAFLNHFGDTRGNQWYSAIVGIASGKDGKILDSTYVGTAWTRSYQQPGTAG